MYHMILIPKLYTSLVSIVILSVGSNLTSFLNQLTSGLGVPFTVASNLTLVPSLTSLLAGFCVIFVGSTLSTIDQNHVYTMLFDVVPKIKIIK